MQTLARTNPRTRPGRRWLGLDGKRALIVTVLLALLIGFGFIFGGLAKFAPWDRWVERGDLASGTVVFVPTLGNQCRQRRIDNATWRIIDEGPVDCGAALNPLSNGNEPRRSASRLDVVREGFRNR